MLSVQIRFEMLTLNRFARLEVKPGKALMAQAPNLRAAPPVTERLEGLGAQTSELKS